MALTVPPSRGTQAERVSELVVAPHAGVTHLTFVVAGAQPCGPQVRGTRQVAGGLPRVPWVGRPASGCDRSQCSCEGGRRPVKPGSSVPPGAEARTPSVSVELRWLARAPRWAATEGSQAAGASASPGPEGLCWLLPAPVRTLPPGPTGPCCRRSDGKRESLSPGLGRNCGLGVPSWGSGGCRGSRTQALPPAAHPVHAVLPWASRQEEGDSWTLRMEARPASASVRCAGLRAPLSSVGWALLGKPGPSRQAPGDTSALPCLVSVPWSAQQQKVGGQVCRGRQGGAAGGRGSSGTRWGPVLGTPAEKPVGPQKSAQTDADTGQALVCEQLGVGTMELQRLTGGGGSGGADSTPGPGLMPLGFPPAVGPSL